MAPGANNTTAAFRVKALLLCARAQLAKAQLAQFVERLGLGKVLEDETQAISVALWVQALEQFEALVGERGFEELPRYLIHPRVLGIWSPLLRGAESPADIVQAIGAGGYTDRDAQIWHSAESLTPPAAPRQRYRLLAELPEVGTESRQLLLRALSAELKSIPPLFGHNERTVTLEGQTDGRCVFELSWQSRGTPRASHMLLGGLLVGGVLGGASASLGAANSAAIGLAAAGMAIGATGALLADRDAAQRATSQGQRCRILALEREAALQKEHGGHQSRPQENTLIAGSYRLGKQIGAGGAGAVWQATRMADRTPVAIKLLRGVIAGEARAADRLQREAEALGLAWHPNVVRLLEHGMLPGGQGYLVLEHLSGETLGQRLRRRGRLPAEEAIRWGLALSDALAAIHSAGVVHRDVKPDNVFLHRLASDEELKLFDFGVAQIQWAETRLTRDGIAVGTRGYTAPEQEDGGEVDPQADLYSLGATLRELVTGERPPTRAPSRPPLAQEFNSEARLSSDLQGKLLALCDRLTAASPDDRPQGARAVRRELLRMIGRESPEDRASTSNVATDDDPGSSGRVA